MAGRYIDENVKRKLYAESLGRCMNPNCQRRLFLGGKDISEKAHIVAYCKTKDNAYENLVLLCPNCHTEFDKNNAFSEQEILDWKRKRQRDIEAFFGKKYATFDDLRKVVAPILQENKTIYEEYYLNNQHQLWDKCEENVLVNNRKLKILFSNNMDLFQEHANPQYSNLAYVMRFMAHVEEFETTRLDEQKNREILFPQEIDSMFGVAPVEEHMIPSTEALEELTRKLQEQGKLKQLVLGCPQPYLNIKDMLIPSGKKVVETITQHMELFDVFEQVYLFESSIEENRVYNDIDILLIYACYSEQVGTAAIEITKQIGQMGEVCVDLTVLSENGDKETGFLQRLGDRYVRLK